MQLSTNVRVTVHQDGALVLDLRDGRFLSVNGVGSAIVEWLRNSTTTGQVLQHLREQFPTVDAEVIRADLDQFLGSLIRLGVLLP
jgi:hypothetical protein